MNARSNRRLLGFGALLLTALGPATGRAQIFTNGATAFHLWTVPGVVKRNGMVTEIICTNIGPAPAHIGVQFLDESGGALNDFGVPPAAGACNGSVLDVPIYGTASIANSGTTQLHEDCIVTSPSVLNGAAKIYSSSKTIACSAVALDRDHAVEDPASGLPTGVSPTVVGLKVVKARKQNGD